MEIKELIHLIASRNKVLIAISMARSELSIYEHHDIEDGYEELVTSLEGLKKQKRQIDELLPSPQELIDIAGISLETSIADWLKLNSNTDKAKKYLAIRSLIFGQCTEQEDILNIASALFSIDESTK